MSFVPAIDGDPEVQHVDVRLYFGKDEDREAILDRISDVLQGAPELSHMISAYPMVSDGFGRLVPDTKPLA